MNPFTQEELDQIDKKRQSNDNLEEYFKEKQVEWSKKATEIFETLKGNLTPSDFKNVVNSQAYALSYRQVMNEEISFFLGKLSKEDVVLKKVKQNKFLFYATGFSLKTSMGEKAVLIDAHTAEYERTKEVIQKHIDFLRETIKSLESFQYSIKNLVSLYEYLGK